MLAASKRNRLKKCILLTFNISILFASLCQARDVPSISKSAVKVFLQNELMDDNWTPQEKAARRFVAAFVDLNGDGIEEVVIYLPSDCGSGGCSMYVLQTSGSSWREAAYRPIVQLPVRMLASRSHGWRDLSVVVSGGGVIHPYIDVYSYNGRKYRASRKVSHTMLRRDRKPLGDVVIPLGVEGEPVYP